jgi:hypothetical protein
VISAGRRRPSSTASGGPLASTVSAALAHPTLTLAPLLLVFLAVPFLAPSNGNLFDDQAGYVGLARYLAAGHFLTGRDNLVVGGPAYPNLWFGPGLPLALTPLVALHVPVAELRLLGPVFLFAAVLVFRRLLLLVVSARAALIGALALGLYIPLYTVIAYLHSEALAVLLIVAALYSTALYLRNGRWWSLLGAAAALAALAVTRVEYGWVVSVLLALYLFVWLWGRSAGSRRLVAVFGLALALCLPWLAYTYSVSRNVFYWSSSGPLSLYWMSSPNPQDVGDWHGAAEVFSNPGLAPHRAFFHSLAKLDLNTQNARLEHTAVTNIVHHPLKFALNVGDNVSRMLFNAPYSFKPAKPSGLVYSLPAGLLLVAMLVGGVRAARRQRRLPPETAAFAAFAIVTFALHAVLAGYPRFLFPIVPIVIWLTIVCWTSPPHEATVA